MDENTAAIAMLLTAAAQMTEPSASPEPVPISIDTLNDLHRQKAEIEQKLAEIEQKLQVMQSQLKGISEEKADLVHRQREIQSQASKLCEVLFGIGTRQEQPQPTPSAVPATPPRKPDNSVVIDRSVPSTVMPSDAPPEARLVASIPSMNF